MKSFIICTTITLCSTICFAQNTTATETADSVAPTKNTLTIGSVYANNASYYGQKSQESTPYIAVAANYRLKCGFYLSGLAYRLLNDKISNISAASLGAGFNFKLAPKFTADISYSHSFYPALSPLLQASNADNASISLTQGGWLNFNLTGDYAFGKTNDEFVTFGISKSINLFSFGKKDIVTINPSLDAVGGTQHFYQSYVTEQKLRDQYLGIIFDPLTGNTTPGSTTTTVAKTSFNLLSYNFKLPLAYNRANYVIEAAYQLSVLSNDAQTNPGKVNSFATVSFFYQF